MLRFYGSCHPCLLENWVNEKLVTFLEESEPRLKLCIHQRDFKVTISNPMMIFKITHFVIIINCLHAWTINLMKQPIKVRLTIKKTLFKTLGNSVKKAQV